MSDAADLRAPPPPSGPVLGANRIYSLGRWGFKLFHGFERPLPEFPAFTHINEAIATHEHVLGEHAHPTFEIVYFHAGRCRWSAGGRAYDLGPGDLWITRPGEPHSGRPDPADPQHNFAIGFDPARLPIAPRAPADEGAPREVALAVDEAQTIDGELDPLAQRVIPGGQGIEAIYRRIIGELERPAPATARERALSVVMVQALLVELLVWVARCASAHRARLAPPARPPARPDFQRLLAWLPTRLADPPALSEMAARIGLSPAHFATVFKQETGRTPLEYLTVLRIEEAATRLASRPHAQVTEIAFELGFSSSQYFAIVFKKVKGRTPTDWQRMHGG